MLIEIDDDRVKIILRLHKDGDSLVDNNKFEESKVVFNQMQNMATNALLTGIAKANKEQG